MARVLYQVLVILVAAIMVAAGVWTYQAFYGDSSEEDDQTDGYPPAPPAAGGVWTPFTFNFEDPSYVTKPLDYNLPLARDRIKSMDLVDSCLGLTDEQVRFLLENGMVGVDSGRPGFTSFSSAYEGVHDWEVPMFITSDSVLDAYHHVFEGVLIELEQGDMIDQATEMSRRLMDASKAQRDALPAEHRHLAEANVVYFAVALRILDPTAQVPAYAAQDVTTIIQAIEDAQGTLPVPGFDQKEDFTQYKPRGHYTRSEELSTYFKAMMWFGRITFQGKFDDETQRAILAATALRDDQEALDAYTSMSQVIDFLVGIPDDLTPIEIMENAEEVLGPMDAAFTPMFDAERLDELQDVLKDLRPPKISSDVVAPGDRVWGMRVFGQRYVPDSYIFQECVFSKVPTRLMPSCLDVMAVMGSEEAWGREDLAPHAPALEAQLTALREEFDGYPDHVWNSTLYWSWLHTLRSLHESTSDPDMPVFTQTRAWSAKELNTQAASWTQLTHDTILYRKQSYTELGSLPRPSDIIYVEPVPELYSRLGDMVRATERGLEYLEMGTDRAFDKLDLLGGTLDTLERVALAELQGKDPKEDDIASLKRFYHTLGSLNDMGDEEEDTKTVLVSDVHTDPNTGTCLEEGVGYVRMMVVAVKTSDGIHATVGAVFSHYEFTQPLSEGRLTDEEWTSMLENGTAPEPAPWAQDFIV